MSSQKIFLEYLNPFKLQTMFKMNIPNLTFKNLQYGKHEKPIDLTPLLYQGGLSTRRDLFLERASTGQLGEPHMERLALVKAIHDHFCGNIAGGGKKNVIKTKFSRLREFYIWCDKPRISITLESIEALYISWTDHLIQRYRFSKDISELHVYQSAVAVAKILNDILNLNTGLLAKTRIRSPSHRNTIQKVEKINLMNTYAYGRALLDIADALTAAAIRGPLPVIINFRNGQVVHEWLKLRPPETLKTLNAKKPSTRANAEAKRANWLSDTSSRTRHPLINLRIACELHIFISQTGINLEQALKLPFSKFLYRSYLNGYQVYRVYKGRRQGEVAFEIFSEYRTLFERYIQWLSEMFPENESGLLFPFTYHNRLATTPSFYKIKQILEKVGIEYIPSRALRKTRINWLLRRALDPELTAEMHSHTARTLLKYYQQPSHQTALIEISRFHIENDPSLTPPSPGRCIKAIPVMFFDSPAEAPKPDCINSAGCLFCQNHRDIDSDDYYWSLASYCHLKTLELVLNRPPKGTQLAHPAKLLIDRINEKFRYFESSNQERKSRVDEALARITEGYYHPYWDGFINLMELNLENKSQSPTFGN